MLQNQRNPEFLSRNAVGRHTNSHMREKKSHGRSQGGEEKGSCGYAPTLVIRCCCCSGLGVSLLARSGTPTRSAIRSGTRSGDTDRTGYSVAGVARSSRDVMGCGARIVGDEIVDSGLS